MRLVVRSGNRRWELLVDRVGTEVVVRSGSRIGRIRPEDLAGPVATAWLDGRRIVFGVWRRGERLYLQLEGRVHEFLLGDPATPEATSDAGGAAPDGRLIVRAPIPGMVGKVLVQAKDAVRRGQALVTLNAMKMENEIQSPCSGAVAEVLVGPGAAVDRGAPLVVVRTARPARRSRAGAEAPPGSRG